MRPYRLIAVALLALILLLGTLQYMWLGRISEAERERLRALLTTATSEFAQDFDRELARAYLLFQTEPLPSDDDVDVRFAARYDRWQASSAHPRILREFYVVSFAEASTPRLYRFNPATRQLEAAAWPAAMAGWREWLPEAPRAEPSPNGRLMVRRMPPPIWPAVPALVVASPVLLLGNRPGVAGMIRPPFSYTILAIDVDYARDTMFPALAERHFRAGAGGVTFQVAVLNRDAPGAVVFRNTPAFSPTLDTPTDAGADFFQVRTQDFGTLATEIRRFAARGGVIHAPAGERGDGAVEKRIEVRSPQQMSIVVQGSAAGDVPPGASASGTIVRTASGPAPRWRVVAKHPAGSLEAAVSTARRRNLFVSTSILAVLGASMALLVTSTRRSQELARQQMEFVATVSHELRTPLAVIRSAGDNLADGVVQDEQQVRAYGNLVRHEGRRLSEMVEQILEFAGIQSGQRAFTLRPVGVDLLVRDVLSACESLIASAGLQVEVDVPAGLPPVLGDETALRRVFQNLIANAIKYGADGGWIGVRARASGSEVQIAFIDRGIGIPPDEQARIFEPFYRAAAVVAAQIHGAGLGLSLVKRIVEGHGGRIVVESAPGAGSEFIVYLPAARGHAVEPLERGAEAAQAG